MPSRREFLKEMMVSGAGLYTPAAIFALLLQDKRDAHSTVVEVRNPNVQTETQRVRPEVAQAMVFEAVRRLSGAKNDRDAWRHYFQPDDIVGIKVNCLFGRGASTRPEVVMAVVEGLKLAGVKPENIIIWDRSDGDLAKAGFTLNREGAGVRCYGTNADYDPQPTRQGSFQGRLSKILSERITALVNVPILKDHGIAGITCALKNHYGSIDNPGAHHGNNCNPYLADLNAVPAIRQKTRLIVCDAIRPIAHGGPGLRGDYAWDYNAILASTDPVAIDTVGWQIIEARRKQLRLPTLAQEGRPVRYLQTAAQLGLGVHDPNRIQLVRVG
ncbi:MAG: DUF362 domain-containing protein [bacterium]|nr:DUF362 domain-containing protein [bacterium]